MVRLTYALKSQKEFEFIQQCFKILQHMQQNNIGLQRANWCINSKKLSWRYNENNRKRKMLIWIKSYNKIRLSFHWNLHSYNKQFQTLSKATGNTINKNCAEYQLLVTRTHLSHRERVKKWGHYVWLHIFTMPEPGALKTWALGSQT